MNKIYKLAMCQEENREHSDEALTIMKEGSVQKVDLRIQKKMKERRKD